MKKKDQNVVEVAYICNGKDPSCREGGGCYYRMTNGRRGPCVHTRDPKYAKYGKKDPKKYPERFDRYKAGNVVRYYEKFV